MSIYNRFYVELDIRDKIYGTLRGDREIFEEFEKRTNQFHCDDIGIYIGEYQIKAMIAQCASLLEVTPEYESTQTLKEGSFIEGINADGKFTRDKVYLLPLRKSGDGKNNVIEHVTGLQGSRSIISNSQFCSQPKLRFQLNILVNLMRNDGRGEILNFEDLEFIFEHGQEVGLGTHRDRDAGKFDVVKFCVWDDYQDSVATG